MEALQPSCSSTQVCSLQHLSPSFIRQPCLIAVFFFLTSDHPWGVLAHPWPNSPLVSYLDLMISQIMMASGKLAACLLRGRFQAPQQLCELNYGAKFWRPQDMALGYYV